MYLCIILILFCGCQTKPFKIVPNAEINNMVVLDLAVMKNETPYYGDIGFVNCENIKITEPAIQFMRKGKYLYAFNVPPGTYIIASGRYYKDYPNKDGSTQTVQNDYVFFDDIINPGHFTVERNRVIYAGKFRISAYKASRHKNARVILNEITGGDISSRYYCLLISYENMITNKMDALKEVKEIYAKTRWGALIDEELDIQSDNIKK